MSLTHFCYDDKQFSTYKLLYLQELSGKKSQIYYRQKAAIYKKIRIKDELWVQCRLDM